MMEMVSGVSESPWFVLSDGVFVQGSFLDVYRDGRRSFNGDGDWIGESEPDQLPPACSRLSSLPCRTKNAEMMNYSWEENLGSMHGAI